MLRSTRAVHQHDGNPALDWCLAKVDGKAGRHGNLYPTKPPSDQKIDAAVAPMVTTSRATVEDKEASGLEALLINLIFG